MDKNQKRKLPSSITHLLQNCVNAVAPYFLPKQDEVADCWGKPGLSHLPDRSVEVNGYVLRNGVICCGRGSRRSTAGDVSIGVGVHSGLFDDHVSAGPSVKASWSRTVVHEVRRRDDLNGVTLSGSFFFGTLLV